MRPAPEPVRERRTAVRARVGVCDEPSVADVAEAERMELADEARAEHADADVVHAQ